MNSSLNISRQVLTKSYHEPVLCKVLRSELSRIPRDAFTRVCIIVHLVHLNDGVDTGVERGRIKVFVVYSKGRTALKSAWLTLLIKEINQSIGKIHKSTLKAIHGHSAQP